AACEVLDQRAAERGSFFGGTAARLAAFAACRMPEVNAMRNGEPRAGRTLRARAAWLGWATAAPATVSLLLCAGAIWAIVVHGGNSQPLRYVELPINVQVSRPAVIVLVSALAGAGAVYVFLAGLETAAAMQVLSPDRQLPAPLTKHERRVRSL